MSMPETSVPNQCLALGARRLSPEGAWVGNGANSVPNRARPRFSRITIKPKIIPGRSPWCDRTEARRWLSTRYRELLQEQADTCGVSVSLIRRKHSPGVAPFFPSISALFADAERPRRLNVSRIPTATRSTR